MKKNDIIDCEELYLRPLLLEDAISLYPLMQDYDVIKYLQFHHVHTMEDVKNLVAAYILNEASGNTWPYAIMRKMDDEFIGVYVVKKKDEENAYDQTVFIGKSYWGKGYFTKVEKVGLELMFNDLDADVVYGSIKPQNIGSQKVIEKYGFQLVETITFADSGEQLNIFKLNKGDYKNENKNTRNKKSFSY